MIQPFKIINDDGTTNQEEYNRCIEFLNNYVNGSVPVSGKLVWANPFEINEDNERSSLEILIDEIYNETATDVNTELVTNRLLTANCFNQFKRFFRGFVKGFSRTIYTSTGVLSYTKSYKDGPGYYYDPFTKEQTEMIWSIGHLPYLNDSERTLMSFNEKIENKKYGRDITEEDNPDWFYNSKEEIFNYSSTTYNQLIGGGYMSLFYYTNHQYKQSNGLFYLSECTDRLLRAGMTNYFEDRLNKEMIFTVYSNHSGAQNDGKQCLGFELNQIQNIIDTKLIYNNTQLNPDVNTHGNYYTITYFDLYNTTKNQALFNLT